MKNTKLRLWMRKHKKLIIIVSTVFAVSLTAAVYYLLKNRSTIDFQNLTKAIETIETGVEKTSDNKVIDINSYFRNLPKGWKVSPEKIKEVQELGLIMPAGKTYVNAHKRCVA